MPDAQDTKQLLNALYTARLGGDLDGICATLTPDARFRIAGATGASPVAITANGVQEYRPLLSILVKTFKLTDQRIISMLTDGPKAAVHWEVDIFSKITGTTVTTELADMFELRDGRISSYTEFFAAR